MALNSFFFYLKQKKNDRRVARAVGTGVVVMPGPGSGGVDAGVGMGMGRLRTSCGVASLSLDVHALGEDGEIAGVIAGKRL